MISTIGGRGVGGLVWSEVSRVEASPASPGGPRGRGVVSLPQAAAPARCWSMMYFRRRTARWTCWPCWVNLGARRSRRHALPLCSSHALSRMGGGHVGCQRVMKPARIHSKRRLLQRLREWHSASQAGWFQACAATHDSSAFWTSLSAPSTSRFPIPHSHARLRPSGGGSAHWT